MSEDSKISKEKDAFPFDVEGKFIDIVRDVVKKTIEECFRSDELFKLCIEKWRRVEGEMAVEMMKLDSIRDGFTFEPGSCIGVRRKPEFTRCPDDPGHIGFFRRVIRKLKPVLKRYEGSD